MSSTDRQLLDSALGQSVQKAVQVKLDASEPFTNACISHPLIVADVRLAYHWDVKLIIAAMWRERMLGTYLRTPVTVYPHGASGETARANLFYPDDGYDPYTFSAVNRILIRVDQSDNDTIVDGTTITNTLAGSVVTKQCSIQDVESTLNVPRFLIKAAGWKSNDHVGVDISGGLVTIKKTNSGKQVIDKKGSFRLHGTTATMLKDKSPIAVLVTPDAGEKYLQIYPQA